MQGLAKRIFWLFIIQYTFLSLSVTYFGKAIAEADATATAPSVGFWDIWRMYTGETLLMVVLVTIVFGIICYWRIHSLPNKIEILFLATMTTILLIASYLFTYQDPDPLIIMTKIVLAHLLSWLLLLPAKYIISSLK